MDVCNLPRGRGKTTYLVYRSHVTQIPILCMNTSHEREIKEMARRLELTIPDPITVNDYMQHYREKKKPTDLLVDEVLLILAQILGTRIDTVTLTECEKMENAVNDCLASDLDTIDTWFTGK